MAQTFHCPTCGAPLDHPGGNSGTIRCPFCSSSVIVPPELRSDRLSEPVLSRAEAAAAVPELASTMREAVNLVGSGQKIAAIELIRKRFKLTLKDARDAVNQIEQGQMVQLSNLTLMTTENPSDHPSQHLKDVLALLEQDQKIEAIRLYQERFGVTLVEARQAVEAIEEGLRREQPLVNVPEVPLRQAARATAVLTAGTGCFTFGLIGFILLVTLVPIFFAMMASGGPLEEWGIRVNPFASQRVELAFGEEGIGEGMFQDPRSIAVASNGDIYIAGYQDGRIQRFDSEGRFLDLWNVGKKEIIYSLEVDRNGIVYAAYGREFNRFEGDSGRQLEPLSNPLDQVAHTIRSMADGGLIAVYGNDSLVRFNATGGVDWVLENSVSTVADETEMTVRVASDGLGNIYALGTSLQAVFKFSPEGKFITRWGSRGEADEQFRAAHAIAVDRQGRVYVSDFNGVKVFENDGRYVSFIRVKGFPFGLDFDGQGRLHVVGNAHRVYRYSVPKP